MADGGGPSAREELFHRTLLELGGTGDPAEQADFCRRLAMQAASSVVSGSCPALVGVTVMEDYLREAASLTDDQEGINNYADFCLTEEAKFKNHSKNWKSGITLADPNIQAMIAAHNSRGPGVSSDCDFSRCLQLPLPPPPGEKPAVKPEPVGQDVDMAAFDLSQDFPEFSTQDFNPGIPLAPPLGRSDSAFRFQPAVRAPPISSHRLETPSRGSPSSSTSAGSWLGGLPGAAGGSGGVGGAGGGAGVGVVGGGGSPGLAAGGVFRTAQQQLVMDRAKAGNGRSESITSSSYGGARRNLGTRPGPTAGFKPPVRPPPGTNSPAELLRSAGDKQKTEEEQDPRYKNIDMKMVELIKNEIMDQGSPIGWDDIAGLQFAKDTVKEIVVWPMMRPDIFTGLRGPPKGLLLFGPPGTGKTLIGKCIASQSGSTFFSISASALTSKWVGEGEKMVRALFAVAKVHQPAVVFIDEIDSLLTARSDSDHESSRKIKTEFLVQLDGASTTGEDRVLVVGATNRPQELDDAARRRLAKRLYIPLPEAQARKRIITNLLEKERHRLTDVQLDEVVGSTAGYSGADMANLCKEAAMGPIRSLDFSQIQTLDASQVRPIMAEDFVPALRQVKASVSEADLDLYIEWNKQYGATK